MAFEDVAETIGEYWEPVEIGDNIEGNIFEFSLDKWNNKRIVLDMGDDENEEIITTTLPSHAHLQRFIPNLEVGDYIKVTLAKLIEPKQETDEDGRKLQPKRVYKVQKDPEQRIDYKDIQG